MADGHAADTRQQSTPLAADPVAGLGRATGTMACPPRNGQPGQAGTDTVFASAVMRRWWRRPPPHRSAEDAREPPHDRPAAVRRRRTRGAPSGHRCPGRARLHRPEGGTLRIIGFRSRIWRPATEAAGLAGLRTHDLRHAAVALRIAAGASPKEVAVRAGHTSVSFTLDRYGHLYPEADANLRDRSARPSEPVCYGAREGRAARARSQTLTLFSRARGEDGGGASAWTWRDARAMRFASSCTSTFGMAPTTVRSPRPSTRGCTRAPVAPPATSTGRGALEPSRFPRIRPSPFRPSG